MRGCNAISSGRPRSRGRNAEGGCRQNQLRLHHGRTAWCCAHRKVRRRRYVRHQKYANNPKTDFLNWATINAGDVRYAGDAWGYTTAWRPNGIRAGGHCVPGFSTSRRRLPGGISPLAYGLDPTFSQFQLVGEIEERHDLWGEPGKVKITGFLSRGRAGEFANAIALAESDWPVSRHQCGAAATPAGPV